MRILYISNSEIPSTAANSIHCMKMCEAMARRGHAVTLIARRAPERVRDVYAWYGVAPVFGLKRFWRPDIPPGFVFYCLAIVCCLALRKRAGLVYGRYFPGLFLAGLLGFRVAHDSHGGGRRHWTWSGMRFLARRGRLIRLVAISDALCRRFAEMARQDGFTLDVRLARSACDPGGPEPDPEPPPEAGRRFRAGYLGHLYPGKGVEIIVEAARRMPEVDFHVVGGAAADLARWRSQPLPPNVLVRGFVPPSQTRAVARTFDALLLPSMRRITVAGGREESSNFMSPLKMFEYMAVRRPIVASRLPVIEEVLRDGENALLADPDRPEEWVQAIGLLARDRELGRNLAARAFEEFSARYTWDARASIVLGGLEPA